MVLHDSYRLDISNGPISWVQIGSTSAMCVVIFELKVTSLSYKPVFFQALVFLSSFLLKKITSSTAANIAAHAGSMNVIFGPA